MKKIIFSILAFAALVFTSCEDFTDVQPKGKNLLTTTDQLEMLLNNFEYDGTRFDMRIMAGDMIYAYSYISTELSRPTKTRTTLMWTFDETNQDKMAELTSSDDDYTYYYSLIGKIANPILNQLEAATGTDEAKNKLKCEALTLRAWAHYMLINKFAKAYNPATAATDRGIVVMTEDKDITDERAQSTVQEVYDQILKDVNEAIELDGLPDVAVNKMRFNKPAAYAVKALALLNMQNWDEAEATAKEALAINDVVNDYNNDYQGTTMGYIEGGTYDIIDRGLTGTEEDYFFNGDQEAGTAITAEALANFEEGHVYTTKISNGNMMYDYTMDAGEESLGQSGFLYTFDITSRWNNYGLRSTQMYLAIAECEVHKGNIDEAMENLDKVRENRIDPEVYEPLAGNVTTIDEAIEHVKQVTLNEDILSTSIFIDKKRWNQMDDWKQTYSRNLAGTDYTIAPDSKMWIFPFPQSVMNTNSLIKQNYKD